MTRDVVLDTVSLSQGGELEVWSGFDGCSIPLQVEGLSKLTPRDVAIIYEIFKERITNLVKWSCEHNGVSEPINIHDLMLRCKGRGPPNYSREAFFQQATMGGNGIQERIEEQLKDKKDNETLKTTRGN